MRIRLKVGVIDVRSDNWSTYSPGAHRDTALIASLSRAASDQEQVALLKEQAYKATADQLVGRYTR